MTSPRRIAELALTLALLSGGAVLAQENPPAISDAPMRIAQSPEFDIAPMTIAPPPADFNAPTPAPAPYVQPPVVAEAPVAQAPMPPEAMAPQPQAQAPLAPAVSYAPMQVAAAPMQVAVSDDPLIDALTSTYQRNPKILAERERQESTDEQIAEAVSDFRPTIGATYDKGRQRTGFNGSDFTYNPSSDKELRVEEPIFRGGGTYANWQSAKQRVRAGAYQLQGIEQQVLLQAVTAYMDVVANMAITEYARNNTDTLERQVGSTSDRFTYGEVTRADVAQAQASLADAHAQAANAQGLLVNAVSQFEHIVGYKPSALTPPFVLPEIPESLEEALEQARRANPQLLGAIHAAQAADYDVRTNESVLLPHVSLVGTMSRQDGIGLLGSDKFKQDQLGVQVSIPLYQSGSEYAKIRAAKATARQSKYTSQDTKLSVEEAVTQAWQQYATASVAATARAEQIKAAQVQLDGMRAESVAGTRTVFDVLDAQQNLFSAQITEAQARRDRVVATYNLLFNLGKLSPENLGLPVPTYDPTQHLHHVAWLPAGF